jgi:hypothetical protein
MQRKAGLRGLSKRKTTLPGGEVAALRTAILEQLVKNKQLEVELIF